jgi:hypothetical protein
MRRLISLLAVIAVVVAACGGGGDAGASGDSTTEPVIEDEESTETTSTTIQSDDDDGGSDTSEAAAETSSGDGECTITVTGDLEETHVFPQSVFTFTSDHWATEDELREIIEFLGEDNTEGSYEELVARGEPIVGWFIYNCVDPDDLGKGVLVLPTNETTPDQFPMGPGTYEVTGGLFDATGTPGTVISSFGMDDEELFGTVDGSGELVISRWDTEALEGTVTFDAVEAFVEDEPREINVAVDFTVMCQPGFHSGCS